VSITLETGLFIAGVFIYLKTTRAADWMGRFGIWGLILLLSGTYLGNFLGPPPPNENVIAWVGMTQWLIVFWGWRIDKHRLAADASIPDSA